MHVLIDLRWMRPGLAGGIENLARSFLAELIDLDGTNEYSLFVPAELRHEFDLRRRRNFRIRVWDGPVQLARGLARAAHRRLSSSPRPTVGRPGGKPDIVLSLSGYIYPDQLTQTNVLLLIDLQHEYFPQFFTPEALAGRRRVYSTSVRHARHMIAISAHSRATVLERYRVDPGCVSVAHPAPDPAFSSAASAAEDDHAVLRRHGLPADGYLLFPANTWHHKNHLGALGALVCLRDRGLRPELVCTGAAREAHAAVLEARRDLGLEDQVRFLGYCSANELPALYRGARALFYPSFFEGFGLPLVEAMASRCPIVCSASSSLPEVAGDAAILVDPTSIPEMADALEQVLTRPDLRSCLVQRGLKRLEAFSWRRFTLHFLKVANTVSSGDGLRR